MSAFSSQRFATSAGVVHTPPGQALRSRRVALLFTVFALACVAIAEPVEQGRSDAPDFRNFFGICWEGSPGDNLAYARQMGYAYVFRQPGMERDPRSDGFFFYLESPEYLAYERDLDLRRQYTPEERRFYETHCSLKDAAASFPASLATGWFFSPERFVAVLDFQQQRVIDFAVARVLEQIRQIEATNPKFRFGGYAWDVPQLYGDFWDAPQPAGGRQITLAYWTGGDHGQRHPETTHEFATYSEGRMQFYRQLLAETKKRYPHVKTMVEPYRPYEDWVEQIDQRDQPTDFHPDLVLSEREGLGFIEDPRLFQAGWLRKDQVGSTTPNSFGEAENRQVAAAAARHGACFSWFGRFGGTGDMPGYTSIREVPARLKLIRLLALWENGNGTRLAERRWDGTTYHSPNAFAGPDLIWIRQPGTNKLFTVFLSPSAELALPERGSVDRIYRTDDLFVEHAEVTEDFVQQGRTVSLKRGTSVGAGYILHLK